jgi:hypothetical protein
VKLKMLTGLAGVGFHLEAGDLTERFDGDEAARLVASGFAEYVAPSKARKPLEKAVKPPPSEER